MTSFFIGIITVPLAGIEPAFHPSQGCVLSIERQERGHSLSQKSRIQNTPKVCDLRIHGVQLQACT